MMNASQRAESDTNPEAKEDKPPQQLAMDQLLCLVDQVNAYYDNPNWNVCTSITVHAYLEYEDQFIGISKQGQHHYVISDSSTDMYVIGGHGWKDLEHDPLWMANLVAFDTNKMHKAHCPIVTAATKVHDQHGNAIILVVTP